MTEMKSEDPGAMGIQCDLMVPGRLRKAGVLSKLGGVRDGAGGNWRTRWCVLEDDFFWYEDEGALLSGQAPKGRIRLDTWFAMVREGNAKSRAKETSVNAAMLLAWGLTKALHDSSRWTLRTRTISSCSMPFLAH
eukprot:scaffold2224_cov261-Pinguiococcus_pyrenoidosus.AAC.39